MLGEEGVLGGHHWRLLAGLGEAGRACRRGVSSSWGDLPAMRLGCVQLWGQEQRGFLVTLRGQHGLGSFEWSQLFLPSFFLTPCLLLHSV